MSIEATIEKNFGSFQLNVSFSGGNEVLAILGGSGCGKSMTLRCIAGIVRPDRGRITVDGVTFFDSERNINLPPQQRRVGLLFQNYALFHNMTVEENIAAGVREKLPQKEKLALARQSVSKFRLDGLEHHLPRTLSGGQQQRVALARILIGQPRILMLDEPFSALDSSLRWEMELEVKEMLGAFPGTTLLVSHSRDEVYRLAQRVCVLEHGTSEPVQTVQDLFERPATRAAALLSGCKNYARCTPCGSRELEVTDWGIRLHCAAEIPSDTNLLGIRRHYVRPAGQNSGENTFACTVQQVIDDVFSTIVLLRPCAAAQDAQYPILEMELQKTDWAALALTPGDPISVTIAPKDLLLLRDRESPGTAPEAPCRR